MQSNVYQRNLVLPTIKLIFDIIAIEAAVIFSYWLRFFSSFTKIIPLNKGIPSITNYFYFSIFLVLVFLVLFSVFHSYRTRIFTTFSQDIPIILKVCFIGILFGMSGAFLFRGFSYSRVVFILIFLNTNIFLILERFIFHHLKKFFIKKGFDVIPVCLIGSVLSIPKVIEQLKSTKDRHFEIKGYVADKIIDGIEIPHLCGLNKLSENINNIKDSALVLAFDQYEYHHIMNVIKLVEGKNIEIFFVPDILDLLTSNFNTIESEGLLLLQLKAVKLSGWQGFIKRIFDVTFSLSGLVLLSPFLILIGIMIKFTSKGFVFYKQERIGMNGKRFEIIKFRSMVTDAEVKSGPVWAKENDFRITPIGGFLRRASLDELPQLMNVIKGDMSLVGPRPERPQFVREFESFIPKYQERHRFRSGITGWAQINGLRGQSSIEERTKYDVFYIENWSLGFDLKILILTLIAILKGENAY